MLIVVDTETTGLNTKTCDIIEIAACPVGDDQVKSMLVNPMEPIPEEVVNITNITDEMVEDHAPLIEAFPEIAKMLHLDDNPYFIAHNAPFDRNVMIHNFKRIGFSDDDLGFLAQDRWICTNRLSRKEFRDTPRCKSTKLTEMQKFLNLDVPESNIAHRAGADVLTCMRLFEWFQDKHPEYSSEDWVDFCWEGYQIIRFPFGKHKGKKLLDIPTDYFVWLFENIDSLNPENDNFDKDLYTSISKEIDRRVETMGIEV